MAIEKTSRMRRRVKGRKGRWESGDKPIRQKTLTASKFETTHTLDGYVTAVDEKTFTVIAKSREGPEEELVFGLGAVAEDQRPLVVPGRRFSWHIGYETKPHGQIVNATMFRFWTNDGFAPGQSIPAKKTSP